MCSFGLSKQRACQVAGLSRSSFYYRAHGKDDSALVARLKELASRRIRWGSPMLHETLRREGLVVNHKRTERVYREAGLSLRKHKRKRMKSAIRITMPQAERRNQRLSLDFVHDCTRDGRKFRTLTMVDDFTRECPALTVDTSLNGVRVCRELDRVAEERGAYPEVITIDNGREFAGRAMDAWAYKHNVWLNFIEPGKPRQNAYIESFNGRYRDEFLNTNYFVSVAQARRLAEEWRIDYNEVRPHSSLGGLPPGEFARKAASHADVNNLAPVQTLG